MAPAEPALVDAADADPTLSDLRAREAPTRGPVVAIMFEKFGPYHVARLNAAAPSQRLIAIEGSYASDMYAWDRVHGRDGFRRVTLFADAPITRKSPSEVRDKVFATLYEHRPDVVVAPGWASHFALAMLEWAHKTRTPALLVSASQASDYPRTFWREWIKRRLMRGFSAAVAGGKPQIGYLTQLGLAEERAFPGYDVVDNAHFAAGAERARARAGELRSQLQLPEKFFVATVRWVPEKNLPRLVEAYSRYRARAGEGAWSLVVLGDGEMRPALEAQVSRLGLTAAVLMPGFKQYDELPVYYGLASALVHVSTTEQWGLVVNEAMAARLPVIVSRQCGCALDLVEEGGNGLLVEHDDVDGIAAAMARIASPECDLAAMSARSAAIIGKWSPETFANALAQAVERALAKPQPVFGPLGRALLRVLGRLA